MADRRMFSVETMSPRLKKLQGVFTVSGTATATVATGCGRGVTVARQSTGKYRVTWADSYRRLVNFQVQMTHDSSTTATYKKAVRGGKVATSSNYVEILLRSNDVVLTNPSTGTAIYWSLEFEDGNV